MEVNKYHVPDFRLDPELIEAAKRIFDKYRNEEATDHLTLSNLLGHKSPSGSYYRKLAALRDYGLLEKRGVRITPLGTKITYPTSDEEKNTAIKEAVLNIPLWNTLFTQFGVNLPKEKFWVDLQRIAGLAAPDAQNLENSVRNAYIDDVKNLKTIEKPVQLAESQTTRTRAVEAIDRTKDMETSPTQSTMSPSSVSLGSLPSLSFPASLGAPIVIKDEFTFKAAKIFWDLIEAQYAKKDVSKETRTEQEQTPSSES